MDDAQRLPAGLHEDWQLLETLLPENWRALAADKGALKGLQKEKSPENLLRVLLLYLGRGYSLKETAVRARNARLGDLTAAAVWNRLKKSRAWLEALCVGLSQERGLELADSTTRRMRVLDTMTVNESGKFGSSCRVHYSMRLPSLTCDFFKVTAMEGDGSEESLTQFPVHKGDCLLAERVPATVDGLRHATGAGGQVIMRLGLPALSLRSLDDQPFDWLAALESLQYGTIGSWPVQAVDQCGQPVLGRVCAVRKTQHAVRISHDRLRQRASHGEAPPLPQTLECAKYVAVFTTFPAIELPDEALLEWYRKSWHVALVLARFESLAQLGRLPKQDEETGRAWFAGKLLVTLLMEKLDFQARTISPWGYLLTTASNIPSVPLTFRTL